MRDHPPITPTPSSNRLAAQIFDRLCEDPDTRAVFRQLRTLSPREFHAARAVASETIAARDEGRAFMRGLDAEPPIHRDPGPSAGELAAMALASRIARLRGLAERCVRVRTPGPADELVETLDELELELRS